ncbi:hypothetical protein V5O48_010178 [Marasmius crinis-equi]|uniref:Uncharacterized protein n=1 Tax=Marasmius crinis-equi TaxID=585013 RepID=A0ABR3F9E8_9AGAR
MTRIPDQYARETEVLKAQITALFTEMPRGTQVAYEILGVGERTVVKMDYYESLTYNNDEENIDEEISPERDATDPRSSEEEISEEENEPEFEFSDEEAGGEVEEEVGEEEEWLGNMRYF